MHGESRRIRGEAPIEFVAEVPLDSGVVAVSGLLYRSGFYRGSVDIPADITPRWINGNQFMGNRWLHPGQDYARSNINSLG